MERTRRWRNVQKCILEEMCHTKLPIDRANPDTVLGTVPGHCALRGNGGGAFRESEAFGRGQGRYARLPLSFTRCTLTMNLPFPLPPFKGASEVEVDMLDITFSSTNGQFDNHHKLEHLEWGIAADCASLPAPLSFFLKTEAAVSRRCFALGVARVFERQHHCPSPSACPTWSNQRVGPTSDT